MFVNITSDVLIVSFLFDSILLIVFFFKINKYFFLRMQFSRCISAVSALPFHSSFFESGGHLLSHTVTSVVPSAARALTIVFGMGTGVAPGRIAARNVLVIFCYTPFMPRLSLNLFSLLPGKPVIWPYHSSHALTH